MLKTYIIAEAGVNHNGRLDLAFQLVDAAYQAGADAVKFQTWKTENLLTKSVQKAEYQKTSTCEDESQYDMIKKLELPFDDFSKLKAYCDNIGIDFMSTSTDNESLDFLLNIGLDRIKISSADITNYPFLLYIGSKNKDVIFSTGMANIQEIEDAISVLTKGGLNRNRITVLHCNTEYPTPFSDVNLNAMQTLKDKFNLTIGYSDHTEGIEVAIAAVALGAQVIEKHFTLDKDMPGPDHKASLNPKELASMIKSIRNIELALGESKKVVTPSEFKNIPIARKSIVAKYAILKGEIFTNDNLVVKRPGTGISPMKWEQVLGLKAIRNFDKDDLITLD